MPRDKFLREDDRQMLECRRCRAITEHKPQPNASEITPSKVRFYCLEVRNGVRCPAWRTARFWTADGDAGFNTVLKVPGHQIKYRPLGLREHRLSVPGKSKYADF